MRSTMNDKPILQKKKKEKEKKVKEKEERKEKEKRSIKSYSSLKYVDT